MTSKHFFDIFGIVLAAEAEQHAGIQLLPHHLLQSPPWCINPDTTRPVFAAYATPEGIVAIQGDHFSRGTLQSEEFACDHSPERRKKLRTVGDMAEFITPGIIHFLDRVESEDFGGVNHVKARQTF